MGKWYGSFPPELVETMEKKHMEYIKSEDEEKRIDERLERLLHLVCAYFHPDDVDDAVAKVRSIEVGLFV